MEKLYDKDAYQREFDSVVVSCLKTEQGYEIVLEATLFFPEEGGQSCDRGSFVVDGEEYPVQDVQIRENHVYHYLSEPIEIGKTVHGCIDFSRRYDFMQNHTGEHILTGCIHNQFGYDNVGFHLNESLMTMDFNGILSAEQLQNMEEAANQIVLENIAVKAEYSSKEELMTLDYRSKKALEGPIRIVSIGEYDCCACCAPHVRRTAEVGMIKIIKAESWKGGTRLTVLCGKRAYWDYARKHEVLSQLAREYSTSYDKLPERIHGDKETLIQKEYELFSLQSQILEKDMIKQGIVFVSKADSKAMKKAVDGAMNESATDKQFRHKIVGVFCGNDIDGYQYLLGSKKVDMKNICKNLQMELNAKGGGNSEMIQGKITATKEKIKVYF